MDIHKSIEKCINCHILLIMLFLRVCTCPPLPLTDQRRKETNGEEVAAYTSDCSGTVHCSVCKRKGKTIKMVLLPQIQPQCPIPTFSSSIRVVISANPGRNTSIAPFSSPSPFPAAFVSRTTVHNTIQISKMFSVEGLRVFR